MTSPATAVPPHLNGDLQPTLLIPIPPRGTRITMRQAALRSALTAKAQDGDLVVVDVLALEKPKTRRMVEILSRLAGDASALILLSERNENVEGSTSNIPSAKTLRANYLNIRDLLSYDKIVMPMDALEVVRSWLGDEMPIDRDEAGAREENDDALS